MLLTDFIEANSSSIISSGCLQPPFCTRADSVNFVAILSQEWQGSIKVACTCMYVCIYEEY